MGLTGLALLYCMLQQGFEDFSPYLTGTTFGEARHSFSAVVLHCRVWGKPVAEELSVDGVVDHSELTIVLFLKEIIFGGRLNRSIAGVHMKP